jgi:hypothetical protein
MMAQWGSKLAGGQAVHVGHTRWTNSILTIIAALLAGVGFGYLMPHSAAGQEDGRWMPLAFDKGLEVFTGTSRTFIPREPGFVSEGNCRLSGGAKFFCLESDDPGVMRLGYIVDLTAVPPGRHDADAAWAGLGDGSLPVCSPYNVQFNFSFFDADGFRLDDIRTPLQRLNPAESCSFRGIIEQPIPREVADRTEKIDCCLCFEGIEIP